MNEFPSWRGVIMGAAAFPLLILIVAIAFTIFCVVDLVRAQEVRYLPRWAWALIICFGSVLGGVAYLTLGRVR